MALLSVGALSLTACSTVSEETCEAGNWEAEGFKDGAAGKDIDRLTKIADACTKHGISVDNQAYLEGYEAGLPKYCTYQRGYERGESGSSYNQVCTGELAEEYAPGYEEGRKKYQIYRQYEEMVERYNYKRSRLYEYRRQLQNPDLTDRQKDRIRYNIRQLERDIDNLRYRIRQFERQYQLRRSSIGY